MASSFLEKKAKKQAEELEKKYGSSAYGGTTWLNNQLSGKSTTKKTSNDDIAPVAKKEEEEERTWFNSGLFADGYDFGDISKTILGLDKKSESVSPSKNLESLLTVYSNDDFKAKSGYVSTAAEGFWDRLGSKYGMGYNDLQYEYINNQNGIREDIDAKAASWGSDTGKTTSSYKEKALDFMTEEEVAVYNYYYQTEGKDKAEEFLDALAETLNARKAGKTFESVQGNTTLEILSGFVAGNEQFEQGVKNLGNMIVGKDDYIPQTATQILTGKIREDLADDGFKVLGSSVGQMAFDAISTGTNMIPSIAVGAVNPAAGAALMGGTAAGNTYQEALNEGLDKDGAKLYATTIGALEGTLQYALGGIAKLGGMSSTINRAVSGIKNGALKFSLEYGGKIASEALEEGLQEVLNPIVKNAILGTDEDVDWENVAYSALLGGIMGAGFGASEVANESLSKNETAVVEKVFNDWVAEAEAKQNGKKLTTKEKNKLYDAVVRYMEKGNIPTDVIEEVLGGESYTNFKTEFDNFFESENFKSYKEALASEDTEIKQLEAQLKELENEPNTVGNSKKYDAIQSQIDELKNNSKASGLKSILDQEAVRINGIKNQLRNEVSGLVKDSRLAESYNELARKNEKFTVDLNQYKNENAKKTMQNLMDSDLGDNSRQFHEFADFLARLSADKCTTFTMTNDEQLAKTEHFQEGVRVNGFVNDNGDIVLNKSSERALNTTVGHEITHVLESSKELYGELSEVIKNYAISKEGLEGYNKRIQTAERLYKDKKNTTAEKEVVADLVGEYLFTDADFIHRLSTENRNIFQKIYDEVKYLCKVVTAGSKEARELEKVKKAFEDAYRADNKAHGGTKYSVSDSNIKDTSTGYAYDETYFTMSYTQDGKVVATLEYGEYDGKPNVKMIEVEPEYRRKGIATKLLQELQKKYPDTEIDFGMTTEDGTKLLDSITYDVTDEAVVADRQKLKDLQTELNELQEKLDILYDTENLTEEQDAELHRLGDRWQEVYESIHELAKELKGKKATRTFVKTDAKYSLSDSDGKQLTTEQQDFFKDSKMRDENGNLKVVDNGGYSNGSEGASTVAIAFDSNQIKSTANEKPTGDADIRYSLSEAENAYQHNLENGDMLGAEMAVEKYANLAMPNSKIRDKKGNLIPVYHGTKDMFYEFDTSVKGGTNGTAEGFGIYTSDDPEVTEAYGDRQIKMYANITKPATSTKKTITASKLAALIKDTCKRQAQKMVDDGEYDSVKDALMDTWVSNYVYTYDIGMDRAYRETANDILRMNNNDMAIIQEVMSGMAIRDYAEATAFYRNSLIPVTGFDGFVTQWENKSIGKKSNIILAFDSSQLKSADAVTYDDNGNVIPLSERFNSDKKDIRYSISGINARTANSSMLLRAEHMLNAGADSETVRQETGWYKGYDGKMRFEIDDSKSELIDNPDLEKHDKDGTTYFTGKLADILNHEDLYEAYPQLRNVNIIIQETEPGTRGIYQPNSNYLTLSLELFKRHTKEYEAYLNGGRKAEIERIEQTPEYKEYNKWYEDEELSEKLSPEKWLEEEAKARDKFFNSDLGKRYYQLKWGKVNIQKSEFGWGKEAREVLMHEIQHAIQKIEDFARGANPGYWRRVLASGDTIQTAEQKAELREAENKLYEIYKQNPEFYTEMTELLSTAPDMPRGKVDWDTLEQIEEDPIEWQEFDQKRDALEEKYGSLEVFDFFDLYHDVERYRKRSLDADDAYYSTAGEIEARDTANRLNLTAEERRNKRPDIDNKRVVFTDRYSLSDFGEQPRRYGTYNIYGKDIGVNDPLAEFAPVAENATTEESSAVADKTKATVSETESVAPVVVEENAPTTVTPEEMRELFPDDLAPAQAELERLEAERAEIYSGLEAAIEHGTASEVAQLAAEYDSITARIRELEADENQRAGSLDDTAVPPEVEVSYPDKRTPFALGEDTSVENPFANRSETAVGSQKVKAYQYENPEVKPYFLKAANDLLDDVNNSQPADSWYNDDLYYESGGEKGFGGNKRLTTKDIAKFKDKWGCSWDDLKQAVLDIIEDNGKENYALAKRVEFLLNDRLLNGYTNIRNQRIEPNQEYIDFLEERQITEYSRESIEAFFANADQYAPFDIAPVAESKVQAVNPYDSIGAAPYGFDPITQLQYEYGNLPDGEHPVREDSMPKSTNGKDKVSLTARTVKGAGATPDEFVDLLHKETVGGRFSYIPITNSDTVQKAYNDIVKKGWEAARGEWEAKVRRGEVSAELTATGSLLLNHAAKAGDRNAWLSVLHDYQIMGTNAGQAVQAMRILKTLTPDDSLYMIERSVEQMVEDMKLGTEIVIDDNLKQNYLNAKTDGERDAARKALAENIAKQIPSTAMDKWTALRYLNMLGNFRTQVRNIIGNLGMSVTTGVRNSVATSIEWIANKASGGKFHRTKSIFVNKAQLKAARNDFENVKTVALNGGKFNDPNAKSLQFQQEVQDARRIFKIAPLEWYRRGTNWAMDTGDLVFSKVAYGRALAGYLKANGIKETDFSKIDQQTLDKARAYAINEAQETTFRDNNWLSSWVSKLGRGKNTPKGVKIVSEGVMPFRKTPANILLRAEEYSPLGFVNATVKSIQAAKGNVTGADVVNSWAKALTGTGLFALGMWLNNSGMLSGGPDEDDDKDWFEDQYGWQNYAIQIGDKNYTIDFLSPAAMPLLMGAQLNELRQKSGIELKDLEKALLSIADPMIEMSMLQGVNDTLDNIRYAESNMGQFIVNACVSYLTQGLTNSFLGQLERSLEGQRMSTYTDKDSDLPAWLQKALGKASAKTPGWDYQQIPYVDAWGETEDIAPLPGLAENTLSPSYISQGITDAVYEELNRLNDAQSDINVYPQTPNKTVTFDDAYGNRHEDYNLSAEEYVELAKLQGQTQKELVEDILSSYLYSGLSDKEKARAVQLAYQYAKEYSRQEVLGADGFSADWMKRADAKGDIVNAIIAHTNDEKTFAYENPEKYQFFTESGISWDDYDSADEDGKREYSNMYTWVSDEDHPGRYSLAKAVSDDFQTFWQYRSDCNNFDAKDENGETVNGLKKERVIDYINSLDIDYGARLILFRSMYDGKKDKETYDQDIIDYLNSREDISYEDMEAILNELG